MYNYRCPFSCLIYKYRKKIKQQVPCHIHKLLKPRVDNIIRKGTKYAKKIDLLNCYHLLVSCSLHDATFIKNDLPLITVPW